MSDIDRACDALYSIQSDFPQEKWIRAGMGALARGLAIHAKQRSMWKTCQHLGQTIKSKELEAA